MPVKVQELIARLDEQRPQASRVEKVRACMQYLVVIERGPTSYGAYVPDLPGCVAVGESREEVETLIHAAIEFHIEGLRADGQLVPEPSSTSQLVTVDA
jgi:predicted RNase H-like HicB family nuclease